MAVTTVVTVFWDKISGALRGFAQAIGLVESEEAKLLRRFRSTLGMLREVREAWEEAAKAKEEYAKTKAAWEEAKAAGKATAEMYESLVKARTEYTEKEEFAAKLTSKYLAGLADLSKNLDKYIRLLTDAEETEAKLAAIDERRRELVNNLRDAQEEYNDAVAAYGASSKEAASALERLKSITLDLRNLESERADLLVDQARYNEQLQKLYGQLSPVERRIADTARTMIQLLTLRERAIKANLKLEAELDALRTIGAKHEDILAAKFRKLAEAESKVLDLEEKIYRLRKSFADKTRELWEAMTKEGIVTEGMIEGKKELELAYGRMMKAQVAFSGVLNRLLPEQVDLVTDFVEAYVRAREEGRAVPAPPAFLTPEDARAVIEYAEAVYEYRAAAQSLYSVIGPLAAQLVENKLASAEVAEAYYSLVSLNTEVREAEKEHEAALVSLKDTMRDVGETVWMLWLAIQTEGTETLSTAEKFSLLCQKLGILKEAQSDEALLLQAVNKLLGTHYTKWSDISDQQLVTAATIAVLNEKYYGLTGAISGLPLGPLYEQLDRVKLIEEGVAKGAETFSRSAAQLSRQIATNNLMIGMLNSTLFILASKLRTDVPSATATAQRSTGGLSSAFTWLINAVRNAVLTFWSFQGILTGRLPAWVAIAVGALNILKNAFWKLYFWFSTVFSQIGRALGGVFTGIWNAITGAIKNIFGLQRGGLVTGPTIALLGERGPELVIPLYNPRRALELLARYMPMMPRAEYGLYAGPAPTYNYTTEEIVITGPIIVEGVRNVEEFTEELKYRARAAAP